MSKQLLTDQNIIDILDAAGYGISYWATSATVDEEAKTYAVQPEDHPTIEGDPEVVITFEKLREAYWKLTDLSQEIVGQRVHKYFIDSFMDRTKRDGIDCGHIDAEAADCMVQVAAWGEVVFG